MGKIHSFNKPNHSLRRHCTTFQKRIRKVWYQLGKEAVSKACQASKTPWRFKRNASAPLEGLLLRILSSLSSPWDNKVTTITPSWHHHYAKMTSGHILRALTTSAVKQAESANREYRERSNAQTTATSVITGRNLSLKFQTVKFLRQTRIKIIS